MYLPLYHILALLLFPPILSWMSISTLDPFCNIRPWGCMNADMHPYGLRATTTLFLLLISRMELSRLRSTLMSLRKRSDIVPWGVATAMPRKSKIHFDLLETLLWCRWFIIRSKSSTWLKNNMYFRRKLLIVPSEGSHKAPIFYFN